MNLTNYNILLNLVNGLIKYGLYNRIIAAIREVAQILNLILKQHVSYAPNYIDTKNKIHHLTFHILMKIVQLLGENLLK